MKRRCDLWVVLISPLCVCAAAIGDDETALGPASDPDAIRASIAAGPEAEEKAGWAIAAEGRSTLLPQAAAVIAALRARDGAAHRETEITPETVLVADLDKADLTGSRGDCRVMEIPGSRIRERRCYYPSEIEQTLNDYQFREELRWSIRQQEVLERERQRQEQERRAAASMNPSLVPFIP